MANKSSTRPVTSMPQMHDPADTESAATQTPSGREYARDARPDTRTGEVPVGPGYAGLQDRPEITSGSPGTKQMSNTQLVLGLVITGLLSIIAFVLARLF